MRGFLLLLAVVAVMLGAGPSFAKKNPGLDMDEYTCNDLMQEKVEDVPLVLMWIDGYISSETGDLYLDKEWIQYLAERIFDDCSSDPGVYVIDIVETIAAE